MSVYRLLDEVKKSLRPDAEVVKVRDELLVTINAELEKREIMARAVPGGSTAKNTFLAGDHDIDIFVRFSLDYLMEEEELSDITEEALARFKPDRIHGSRDYFQFVFRDHDVEVVPVLAVEDESQARNVTDMSPLHVEYFRGRGEGLEDEVRLAKQFCKAAGVYGAESYIRGLSGHVIDLLILHYGSFYELVKAAARWKAPVVIDLESHHDEPLGAIDEQKHAPLIIVDPVQPYRNAAAALSKERFDAFVRRCDAFLKDPSEEFFIIPTFDAERIEQDLAEADGASVRITVTHAEDDKRDVAGARIRKTFERIGDALERSGFTVTERGWHFAYGGESWLWFVTAETELDRHAEREGPPVTSEEDAKRFRLTHKETYERDGRLYTQAERIVRRPEQVPAGMRHHLEQHVGVKIQSIARMDAHAPDPRTEGDGGGEVADGGGTGTEDGGKE